MAVCQGLLSATACLAAFFSAAVAAGDCYYTETHCQCLNVQVPTAQCLDLKQPASSTGGSAICFFRPCKESYQCSCELDATEFCERKPGTKSYWVADHTSDGDVFCHTEEKQGEILHLLPGCPVPDQPPIDGTSLGVWNSTHCACSPKSADGDPGTCFDHHSKLAGDDICCPRPCVAPEEDMVCDIMGSGLCKRTTVMSNIWVNDGPAGSTEYFKCHQEMVAKDTIVCQSGCSP